MHKNGNYDLKVEMKMKDKVIRNDLSKVSDKNKGRVFTVKREPWDLCGMDCVFLEEYSGGYAVNGLTMVNGIYHQCSGNNNQRHFYVGVQPLNPEIRRRKHDVSY